VSHPKILTEPAAPDNTAVREVHDFWNVEPCGSHFVDTQTGSQEFFRKYREFRYSSEWHIPLLVPFNEARGKKVLEIGCGNGADGTLFASAGADYTGVDLTEAAIEASSQHFRLLGLRGRFKLENSEHLSFSDESFDFVYSYGVLHHSPNPDRAFREVYRVLKPGGKAVIMVYHKHSFNYYIRILAYMRARVLWRVLSRLGHFSDDRRRLRTGLSGFRGNRGSSVWEIHYQNFLRRGWSYLSSENFVHHATDGPECPFAFVYTRKDARSRLANFCTIETRAAHFPLRKYPAGRWIPFSVEKALSSVMGWYLFLYLSK